MRAYLQVRSDIEGYRAVVDAVKAVETVAASHIQRLRNATLAGDSYVETVRSMLAAFSRHHSFAGNRLLCPKAEGDRVLVVLGGDRGMVGGLYGALIAEAVSRRAGYDRVVTVGERMEKYAREEGITLTTALPGPSDDVYGKETQDLSDLILGGFLDGDWRSVDILHAKFISLGVQQPVITGFLPFNFTETAARPAETAPLGLPLFVPASSAVADALLKRFAALFFYSLVSEAKLSEFAARTLAMENAGNKAQEQIERARLDYFKERRRDFSQKQIESFFAHRAL